MKFRASVGSGSSRKTVESRCGNRRYRFLLSAAVLLLLGTALVIAQEDDHDGRTRLNRIMGVQARLAAELFLGRTPFDLGKAKGVFATLEEAAAKIQILYPGDTPVVPPLEVDLENFSGIEEISNSRMRAEFAKLEAEARLAQTVITDFESFKEARQRVFRQCTYCHEYIRARSHFRR